MSNGFDAYHKWLSIPPHDQPPNHYRLLGLGLFESDPDVIAAAADRQMAHVQTYKTGPHSELSQKLLNEISAAKLCLLRPQKKSAYDHQLGQQLTAAPTGYGGLGTATAAPMAPPAGSGAAGPMPSLTPPAGMPAIGAARISNPAPFANADSAQPMLGRPGAVVGTAGSGATRPMPYSGYSGSPIGPPPPALPPPVMDSPPRLQLGTMTILVAAGLIAVLLVVGIVVVLGHRNDRSAVSPSVEKSINPGTIAPTSSTASASNSSQPNPVQAPPAQNPPTVVTSLSGQTSPFQSGPKLKPLESPANVDPGKKPVIPAGTEIATAMGSNHRPPDKTLPDKTPPDKTNPQKTNPDKANPARPRPDPSLAGKAAVPSKAAIAAVEQRLGSTAEISTADLLDQAHKAAEATEIYVLLRRTIDSAIKQGDAATAISTVDELVRRFAVDSLEVRMQALDDLQSHAKTSESLDAVADAAGALIDEATAAGKPDVAEHLAATSLTLARKSGNVDSIRKITLRIIHMRNPAAAVSNPTPPGP